MRACDRTGCPHEGQYIPKLLVWGGSKQSTPPAEMIFTNLRICASHKAASTPADFLTDHGKWEIGERFKEMGKAAPIWDTCEVDWIKA